MKKIILLNLLALPIFLFSACEEKSDTDSSYTCPTVEEDSCMTDELYQECLDVVATCESGSISVMESCPYAGFGCEE